MADRPRFSTGGSKSFKRKLHTYSKRQQIRILNRVTLEDVNDGEYLDLEVGRPIDKQEACAPDNTMTTTHSPIAGSSTISEFDYSYLSGCEFEFDLGQSDLNSNSGSEKDDFCNSEFSKSPSPTCNPFPDDDYLNKSDLLKADLKEWALLFNIPNNALSHLMVTLKKYLDPEIELPKDARTIMKTPKSVEITDVCNGQYWHFGLVNAINLMCNDLRNERPNLKINSIELLVNIDGLPISNSSTACFWPILISEPTLKKVYIAGCFYGNDKPTSANEFLQRFVCELVNVIESGFRINDDIISVSLFALICDVPAKSFLLCVKGHSGYSSCTKCCIHGEYIENRVCFPTSTCVPYVQPLERTDESFRDQNDEDFHTGNTIFMSVPHFGSVTNVPLDYLHLVCLGVVKKLIQLWMCGPLNVRLPSSIVKQISLKLLSLQGTVPREFERKPRSLQYWKYWKASEFRQFILYTGPVILNLFLKEDVMLNFLSLHIAIKILTTRHLVDDPAYMSFAASLLQYFVQTFEVIYGKQFVSHNVHNLLHLTKDVKTYGVLDNFSAFRFESFLYQIKKKIRKGDLPLQQLAKRYIECTQDSHQNKMKTQEDSLKNEFANGPLSENLLSVNRKKLFAVYDGKSFFLNVNRESDRTVMLKDGSILTVCSVVKLIENDQIHIVGTNNKSTGSLYSFDDFESKKIGIQVIEESNNLMSYPLSDVLCKVWRMSFDNKQIVIPLSHH